MSLRLAELKEIADLADITTIGVAKADPLFYMQERLSRRIAENRLTSFEEKDPGKRISPDHLMKECKSIITFLTPYGTAGDQVDKFDINPKGLVARCARGADYHLLVEKRAKMLIRLLRCALGSSINCLSLCDRSPLLERELAYRSGLGFIGKNCSLVNDRYGSFTAIGTILTDIDFESQITVREDSCGECEKCLQSCPTGAFDEAFVINPFRCLSYLSQSSGLFPRSFRSKLGSRLYGCDLCQDVCPFNNSRENPIFEEAAFPLFPAEPLLIPILTMSRSEYDSTIGLTAAGWRGKTTLQRNAVIALGNSRDVTAVQPLAKLLENDSRPLIRIHAAWALGQIGTSKARYYLEKSSIYDPEVMVRQEAKVSLDEND